MTRTDHFSAVADAYASYRPMYPASLFEFLASLPSRRRRAWDCGAGSGQATHGLLPYFSSVVATDISRSQLAAARAPAGLHRIAAAAERAPLATGSVDLVIVAQALHWIDHEAFYAEVRRVLGPGGAISVWTYGLVECGESRLDAIVRNFYDREVGDYWPPQRRLVDERYRGIPFPFADVVVPEFSMIADWPLEEFLGYVGTWSAVSRYRVAKQVDPVADLAARLGGLWGPRRLIAWPLSVRAGLVS